MNSFGEYIKNQRELRQISIEEVSGFTKVSFKYLNALENDRQELLPSKPFVLGFLRVYSKYMGLDEDSVITRYIDYNKGKYGDEENSQTGKKRSKSFKILSSALFVLIISVIMLAVL